MSLGSELVAELLVQRDNLNVRRVLADRLLDAGDPRGELMAVQCALAAGAPAVEDYERLRAHEATLLARPLPELDPARIELDWRLGFIHGATVLDDVRTLLPRLLAHPAARLLEELTLAVHYEELPAIAELIHARPLPSLLRKVTVGGPTLHRRWIDVVTPEYIRPLVDAGVGIAVLPMSYLTRAGFEAEIEDRTDEHRNELWIMQIAPVTPRWSMQAELRVRAGCDEQVAAVHASLSQWARSTLPYDPAARVVRVYHARERTYVGYANLYRAIRALAPFVEDTRFTMSESFSVTVDELAIVRGELAFRRGFAGEDNRDAKREYWYRRTTDEPRDRELREFVARLYADDAEVVLGFLERRAPHDTDPRVRDGAAARSLDRALALDDRNAHIWQLRGRLARAAGDLREAERCFQREQALDPRLDTSFDLAVTLFASHAETRARGELRRLLASHGGHTGGRLLAGYLAHRAGEAEEARAHAEALIAAADARRAELIAEVPPHHHVSIWHRIEPHAAQLVQTARHRDLTAWLREMIAAGDPRDPVRARGAASYLLAWAEHFRLRFAHGRELAASARFGGELYAAAAAIDPLGGAVHYHMSLFDRRGLQQDQWRTGRALARDNLERALEIAPNYLPALGDLGALHRDLGEHERAIGLLERYLAVSRALQRPGEARGMYWDFHATELGLAYQDRACALLYGAPSSARRRAGRPTDEVIARAETAVDGALAVMREQSDRERRELVPCFLVKAALAELRGYAADALAWADRAVALDDTCAPAYAARASALLAAGALDDAAAAAELGLELDEACWAAHRVIACVAARRGADPAVIRARVGRVLALWPEGAAELAADPDLGAAAAAVAA